jgi:hypothetical protein
MKVTERRIVAQDWYKTEMTESGHDSHGWRFDDGSYIEHRNNWVVVNVIYSDIYGNPIVGIAEREVEI